MAEIDNNLMALFHVQRALIAALCVTHPAGSKLESAFSFFLEQSADRLDSDPALLAAVAEWAQSFRRHFPAPASNA